MIRTEALGFQQAAFKDAAREAFRPLKTRLSDLRESEKDTSGAFAEIWKCLTQIGWFGCLIPEKFGGSERGILAMALAYEELASQGVLTPFPVLTALSTACIARFADNTLKQHVLPRIAKGQLKVCVSPLRKPPDSICLASKPSPKKNVITI